jgi:hypothetical protein
MTLYSITTMSRQGNRWSVSEVLSLQREYELLGLSVQEIAAKHNRSVNAILFKLNAEGLTSSLYEATGYSSQPLKNFTTSRKDRKNLYDDAESVESDTDSSSDYEEEQEFVDDESETSQEYDHESDVDKLSERVWSLETSLGEIGSMVRKMFDTMVHKNSKKLAPLRKRV